MKLKSAMLADVLEDPTKINYPVGITPKIDGFRCLTLPTDNPSRMCKAVTRSMKPQPNTYVRDWLENNCVPGLDGELVVVDDSGNPLPFNELGGQLRKFSGEPNFRFLVFDLCEHETHNLPYVSRMAQLKAKPLPNALDSNNGKVGKLLPKVVKTAEELQAEYELYLAAGHEGLMLRSLDGPYKQGRSSVKEGYLLKLKPFKDEEGWVVGYVEGLRMDEHISKDERIDASLTRESEWEGQSYTGNVGALIIKPAGLGPKNRIDRRWFNTCGAQAKNTLPELYFCASFSTIQAVEGPCRVKDASSLLGRLVTFRHWSTVSTLEQRPRFPQLVGWRDPEEVGL